MPVVLVGEDRADDHVLVERVRAGDRAAFAQLFQMYYPLLAAFAETILRRRDVAEECVQDVFVRLWQTRARWAVRGSVRTYLFSAVRNGALNVLDHQRVADRWTVRAAAELTDSGMSAPPEPADARAHAGEIETAARAAIDRLPQRRREALLLRVQHHLTNPQIAQVMGVTVKCVEIHVAQALRTLRQELADLL